MPFGALKAGVEAVLTRMPQSVRGRRLAVLCYHSAHPSAEFPTRTAPEMLERQMRWLREHCRVVRFADVWDEARRPGSSQPTVAVTFDDGHADNHTTALPILLRYEIPATFFVATGLIDRDPEVIAARSWRGWRETDSTLTWEQVLDMRDHGMDIGSHGHTHTALARLPDAAAFSDLARSKQSREERLGERVVAMAYPKGRPRRDVLPASVHVARGVGFEHGATVLLRGVKRSDEPMMIPRFPIAADGLDLFRAKVMGRLDLIGTLQERAPLSLLRTLGP